MTSPLSVGFARAIITPPLPFQLAGHRGPRMAVEIGDDLFARVVAWSYRDTLGAIVSCDLIWLPARLVARIRERISRCAAIRPENVMVACTHTHSGPDTLGWYSFAAAAPDWWTDWLVEQIASTAFLASRRLAPAIAEIGRAEFALGVNRRMEHEGTVYREPNGEGDVDRRMTTIVFRHEGRPIAGIAHAAMHPVVLGADSALVSGDWCGMMVAELEAATGAGWMFLNGAAGDCNPAVGSGRDYATVEAVGRAAATAAGAAMTAAAPLMVDSFRADRSWTRAEQQRHPFLVVEQDRRSEGEGGLIVESQAMRLGPLTFIGLAGECLFDTMRRIEAATPDALVVSYANDYIGYLPICHHYRQGGYEPAASMLSANGAEAYVSDAIANARGIARRTSDDRSTLRD